MRKKFNKRFNIKKFIVLLIIFIILILIIRKILFRSEILDLIGNIDDTIQNREYEVIKQDNNDKYSGIGQKQVSNKDGYYTTFTTIEQNQKTYIEYKQNGNASWSKNIYWNNYMKETGCGITSMAIILSGYNIKATPEDLRNKYYPVLNYDSLKKEFSESYGINSTDFYYDSIHLSKDYINNHLLSNRPVLICVWNKPKENRWTTDSHYMVLLASDGNDMVYVSNPNGGKNNSKSSGWYNFDEVIPYIAKALFIESY